MTTTQSADTHTNAPSTPYKIFDLRCFTKQGYEARLLKFHFDTKKKAVVLDGAWKVGEAFCHVPWKNNSTPDEGIYRHEEEFTDKLSDTARTRWVDLIEMAITVGGKKDTWGEFTKVHPAFNEEEKELIKKMKLRRLADMM